MDKESTTNQAPPTTHGVHHVGLTVDDINACCAFFVDVLGFKKIAEKPAYPAIFVSDGRIMLTLWQVADLGIKVPFDRKNNIGLHHLALRVADKESLHRLHQTLREQPGVDIEFSPEKLGAVGDHMMTVVPGGVRLEFVAELDSTDD